MKTPYAISARQQCELLVAFSGLSAFKRFAQDPSEEQLFAAMAEYYELVGDIVASWLKFISGGGAVVRSALATTSALTSSVTRSVSPRC